MSAITITSPPNTYPHPVENEICFGFLADKYLLDAGRVNYAEFQFFDSQPNVNGEEINIMGIVFTVSDTSASSASTWNGTTVSGETNRDNFADMLRKSYYFSDYLIETNNDGGSFNIEVRSKGNFDQEGWDDIDDTGLSNPIVGSVINGQSPSYVNGYRIMYRAEYYDGSQWCAVCDTWNVAPVPIDVDYSPLRLDVPIQGVLSRLVKTTLPVLTQAATALDATITKQIRVRAGSQKSGATTAVDYNEFTTTDEIEIINAALQVDGDSDMSAFIYSVGSSAKFLSSRPQVSKVCSGDYVWLWYYCNALAVHEANGDDTSGMAIEINMTFKSGNTTLGVGNSDISLVDGVLIIPVGPANSLHDYSLYPTADKVIINLTAEEPTTRETFQLSLPYTFHIVKECCNDAQLFFLSPFGGYDTLSFVKTTAIEISSEMTEICTDDPCGGDLLSYGKSQTNGKSFERVVLETTDYQKNPSIRRFLRDFKISESRFILTKDEDGNDMLRRFLVESGSLRVWQDGEKLRISLAGYYANEFKQQSQG